MSNKIDIKTVVLTPEVTIEYIIERWEGYSNGIIIPYEKVIDIKNEKYFPLVYLDYNYDTICGIFEDKSFGYHFLSQINYDLNDEKI